jgi:invasion protein IalB
MPLSRVTIRLTVTSTVLIANLAIATIFGFTLTFAAADGALAQAKANTSIDQSSSAQPAQGPKFVTSNWVASCKPQGEAGGLICQASQTITMVKSGKVLLSVHVSPWTQKFATAKHVLRLKLPHGVDMPAGAQIHIDDKAVHTPVFQTSDISGLYARIGLSDKLLTLMQQGKVLNVIFSAMNGKKIQVPLTLKGFTAVFAKIK